MTRPEAQDWRTAALTPNAPPAMGQSAGHPERRPPPPRSYGNPESRQPTDARTPAGRGPRRAKLQVRRVDPWSVLKFSLVLSVVLCIVLVVAVAILYLLLSGMGVFDSINKTVSSFREAGSDQPLFTASGVIGVALVIGLADVVLFTAMATLGAFAYNLCADLVGGIEVTLSEHE